MILLRFALLLVTLLFSFVSPARAQVSNTAPDTDWERDPVCWDNSGTDSTIYQVALYITGESQPAIVRYESYDGTPITVGSDEVTIGPCSGDAGGPGAPGVDYLLISLCDDGTPFYRLIRIDESDDSTTDLGDFDTDFSAYTVSGSVTSGPCYVVFEADVSYALVEATAGSIVAGKQSVSICNAGATNVNFTADGTTSVLLPGACWNFAAYLDPVTQQYKRSPLVSWDDSGRVSVTAAD